jgi:hypothetical protein
MTEHELDAISETLIPLNTDELVVCVVNSRLAQDISPLFAASSFLNLVGTISTMVEDDDKSRIIDAMRNIADVIERGLLKKLN